MQWPYRNAHASMPPERGTTDGFNALLTGLVASRPNDDQRLADGVGWRGALHLLVGHIPAGHHEFDLQGATQKQADHGSQHALAGTAHSHGPWPFDRRTFHWHVGRTQWGTLQSDEPNFLIIAFPLARRLVIKVLLSFTASPLKTVLSTPLRLHRRADYSSMPSLFR